MSHEVMRRLLAALRGDGKLAEWGEGWLTYQLKKIDREAMIQTLKLEWCAGYVRTHVRSENADWDWDKAGFSENLGNELASRLEVQWDDQRQMVEGVSRPECPVSSEKAEEMVRYCNEHLSDEFRNLEYTTDPKYKVVPEEVIRGRGKKIGWRPR